ncbi:hypothetical protein UACE39S_00831 [Ureibacillus acetophenoni]
MKILTTQLTGLFQRIAQSEEDAIEETARLLAQASVGEGKIYFACFDELQSVELNALHGSEPFTNLAKWTPETVITDVDRVCIFTKNSQNEQALTLAKKLSEDFIPFAAVASEKADEENPLSDLAYTYISMKVKGGILPHPTKLGERVVIPHLMAALFIYEAIKLSYDEMIDDGDELL